MQGNEAGTEGPKSDSAGAEAFALSNAEPIIIGLVPAGATAPDDALAAVSAAPAGAALAAGAEAPAAALASGSAWGGGGGALLTGAAREQADAVPHGATGGATGDAIEPVRITGGRDAAARAPDRRGNTRELSVEQCPALAQPALLQAYQKWLANSSTARSAPMWSVLAQLKPAQGIWPAVYRCTGCWPLHADALVKYEEFAERKKQPGGLIRYGVLPSRVSRSCNRMHMCMRRTYTDSVMCVSRLDP